MRGGAGMVCARRTERPRGEYPGNTTPGVKVVCPYVHDYSCAGGGYNATTAQFAYPSVWDDYGGPKWATYDSSGPHNCTLYAAYRLAENGVQDPGWSANARDWGTVAQKPPPGGTPFVTNHTPAPGTIAVFSYGQYGHVAYVESATYNAQTGYTILLSEDNAGLNETRRETITQIPGGPGTSVTPAWPDWFIHAADQGGVVRGDINMDGRVDGLDLSIMAYEWGKRWYPPLLDADLNGDGWVNISDLAILATNWGRSASPRTPQQPPGRPRRELDRLEPPPSPTPRCR